MRTWRDKIIKGRGLVWQWRTVRCAVEGWLGVEKKYGKQELDFSKTLMYNTKVDCQ
jgi:hypothetical protein